MNAMRHFLRYSLLALLVFTSASTFAGWLDGFEPMQPTQSAQGVADLPKTTVKIVDAAVNGLTGVLTSAPSLVDKGLAMLVALFAMRIGWIGVKVAGGASDLAQGIADFLILGALATFAIAAFYPLPGMTYFFGPGGTLGTFIVGGFEQISGVSMSDPVGKNANQWMDTIKALWDVKIMPVELTGMSAFLYFIGHWVEMLLAFIFQILAIVGMTLAAVLTLAHVLMAAIQLKFVLYLSPILVPWVLAPPVGFLFHGWLKSLMSGGLLLFIGSLFAKGGLYFMSNIAGAIPTNVNNYYFESMAVVMIHAVILFSSVLFILIASKLDNLASGVLSGQGTGGFGFHQMKQAAGAIAGAPKAVAGAASGAAGMVAAHKAGQAGIAAASQVRAATGMGAPMSAAQKASAYTAGRGAANGAIGRGESFGAAISRGAEAGAHSAGPKSPMAFKAASQAFAQAVQAGGKPPSFQMPKPAGAAVAPKKSGGTSASGSGGTP